MMSIFKKYNIRLDKKLKIWNLDFSFLDSMDEVKKDITAEEVLASSKSKYKNGVLTSYFNTSLVKGFMFEENYSEQAIISSFLL